MRSSGVRNGHQCSIRHCSFGLRTNTCLYSHRADSWPRQVYCNTNYTSAATALTNDHVRPSAIATSQQSLQYIWYLTTSAPVQYPHISSHCGDTWPRQPQCNTHTSTATALTPNHVSSSAIPTHQQPLCWHLTTLAPVQYPHVSSHCADTWPRQPQCNTYTSAATAMTPDHVSPSAICNKLQRVFWTFIHKNIICMHGPVFKFYIHFMNDYIYYALAVQWRHIQLYN